MTAQASPARAKQDRQQRINLRRHLMAAVSSLLVISVVFLFAWFGLISYPVLYAFAVGTLCFISAFIACFQSGLNKRFADPSLTVAQLVAAGAMLAYLAHHAGPARAMVLPFYMVALLFGTLRLPTLKLLWVSAFYLATYGGAVMWGLQRGSAAADTRRELLLFIELGIVLSWFAWMGGYVRHMRKRLNLTNAELAQALERIEFIASYDELTGIFNRRMIRELLLKEKKRCDRRDDSLVVCMLDLDHFKRINDTHGHAAGDEVLKGACRVMQSVLRETDYIGRYGGEEFIVVLPQTSMVAAFLPLDRIRAGVEAARFDALPHALQVTVSMGAARYRPGETIDETIQRADLALYKAKQGGRNRVELSDE
jgi:diguanylate cyclase (GGDEF)-like protein